MKIEVAEIYDKLCQIISNYENPGFDNDYTEENKNDLLYIDIISLIENTSYFPQ